MDEEWTCWYMHDGGPAPRHLDGFWLEIETTVCVVQGRMDFSGNQYEQPAGWDRSLPPDPEQGYVIQYRIRKSKGMKIIEELLKEIVYDYR